MCLPPIYGDDVCLYDKKSLNFGVTCKLCKIKTIWRNLIFSQIFQLKLFGKKNRLSFDIYMKYSVRSFCLQGDPGPRGETGHAGPQGEKVRLHYFFLLLITFKL